MKRDALMDSPSTPNTLGSRHKHISAAKQKFETIFGASPRCVVSAPGRVNLIGEHTDYNDGYVFPVAIDKYIHIAMRARTDRRAVLHALDVNESFELNLDALRPVPPKAPTWSYYLIGVASLLQESGNKIAGIDAVIIGDVPIGAGLSSSAALSVSAALAFLTSAIPQSSPNAAVSEARKKELAAVCQRVEHEFVGVNCGIMDQTISLLGRADHGLFLDCRSLAYEHVPLNLGAHCIAICNTKVKRELAASEYNKRRAECERGVDILSQWLPGISSLRDITLSDFKKREGKLPALTQKRCGYVIEENTRVLDAVSTLKARNQQTSEKIDDPLIAFGKLMNASHKGLRDDYAVSCRELDLLTDIARDVEGVIGTRMTGAGFGGCTVSILHRDALETFRTRITTEYRKQTGIEPEIYLCNISNGAQVFNY
ncbi:galactokinase [Candidatus Poribacteria bacterium]|nr:galactokinase [Candidatus Poribacteria bacterium]MYK19484.1 galactokinase [Candidatus Poribacteria bacterium]